MNPISEAFARLVALWITAIMIFYPISLLFNFRDKLLFKRLNISINKGSLYKLYKNDGLIDYLKNNLHLYSIEYSKKNINKFKNFKIKLIGFVAMVTPMFLVIIFFASGPHNSKNDIIISLSAEIAIASAFVGILSKRLRLYDVIIDYFSIYAQMLNDSDSQSIFNSIDEYILHTFIEKCNKENLKPASVIETFLRDTIK